MAAGALFVGWGPAVRGREQRALQVFDEALQYYTRLQQQGDIDSFEPVLLEPHGGDLGGFILVRGDQEKLSRVRTSDEFQRLNARAGLIVENLGVITAFVGEGLQHAMGDFHAEIAEVSQH